MVKRTQLINYMNDFLNINEFKDYCHNGLQVEGAEEINQIALGVSLSRRLIEAASKYGCEMILVHHGIFKNDIPSPLCLTGIHKERIKLLLMHDINLVGYHLPLDANGMVGNNISIANALKLNNIKPVDVGFSGDVNYGSFKTGDFANILKNDVFGADIDVKSFMYGPDKISRICVISGGSSDYWQMAVDSGADTFICGSISENVVRLVEEAKMNLFGVGHYNSEKMGVKNLGKHIESVFNVKTIFYDIPNPV